MEIFDNTYIGYVDILGYGELEATLRSYGTEASEAIITRLYNFLDTTTGSFGDDAGIVWRRYGDGYIVYSQDGSIDHLFEIVRNNCTLLALSLNQSIPLRVAITQEKLNVDNIPDGTTISGAGWDLLRQIENSLNWMGGFLYLPHYNGNHVETVQNLIQTTYLVIEQNHAPHIHFQAPFKENLDYNTSNTWFLNWQKLLQQPKDQLDTSITNWWNQFVPGNTINESDNVREKQSNTISFADYCRELYHASSLVYFSEINRSIDMGEISPG